MRIVEEEDARLAQHVRRNGLRQIGKRGTRSSHEYERVSTQFDFVVPRRPRWNRTDDRVEFALGEPFLQPIPGIVVQFDVEPG